MTTDRKEYFRQYYLRNKDVIIKRSRLQSKRIGKERAKLRKEKSKQYFKEVSERAKIVREKRNAEFDKLLEEIEEKRQIALRHEARLC